MKNLSIFPRSGKRYVALPVFLGFFLILLSGCATRENSAIGEPKTGSYENSADCGNWGKFGTVELRVIEDESKSTKISGEVKFIKFQNSELIIEVREENGVKKMFLGKWGELFHGWVGKPENRPFLFIDMPVGIVLRYLYYPYNQGPCGVPADETTKEFYSDSSISSITEDATEHNKIKIITKVAQRQKGKIQYDIRTIWPGGKGPRMMGYWEEAVAAPLPDTYDLTEWKLIDGSNPFKKLEEARSGKTVR